jgi:rSAM/selenodomain-associated transferase 1
VQTAQTAQPAQPAQTSRLTALFTKRPTPGEAKTRLCPPLTPAEAGRLAEAMLRDTVERCLAGEFRTVLAFAPPEASAWFRGTFPELEDQRAQLGADLGERLARFVADSFARGEARSLVVIGSDQPLVPLTRIEEAHRALERGAGCVLGPDPGGGYYLIGLARSVPELFTAVPMSSRGMCDATEALAREHGLAVERLAEHGDVDTPADLERLCAALADQHATGDMPFLRHTRRALAELALLPRELGPRGAVAVE